MLNITVDDMYTEGVLNGTVEQSGVTVEITNLLVKKGHASVQLEERIARLEILCNKSIKQMNEAGLLIDNLLTTITKNLPLMLDTLNKFNEILKTDQITDQSEKVKKIDEFNKLGEEIIEMLNTFGKR